MFLWNEANIHHIAEHGITPDEFEAVLYNRPLHLRTHPVAGEERIVLVGVTDDDRHLVVVVAPVGEDERPVTAFPASKRLIARYEGWRRSR